MSSTCLFLGAALLCCGAVHAEMRIASLNIAKKYGPGLVSAISNHPELRRADILLLQEVVDGPKGHVASDVAKAMGMKYVFEPAFRLNADFDEGLAILSRYPIGAPGVTRLPHNSLHFHTRKRIVLSAMIATPAGPLRVINTHLDNRINAGAKSAQLAGIWRALGNETGPAIIGGDFNSSNFKWVSHLLPIPGVQSLNALVKSQMAAHGFTTPLGKGKGTEHFLNLRLDWIYLRGLRVTGSGVTPIPFSDHNSVWVAVAS